MLRLNDIKLPLDHGEGDLAAAIASKLGVGIAELQRVDVFKRSYDARNKSNILLIYQVDVELDEDLEASLLESLADEASIRPSPDTRYRYVAQADACLLYTSDAADDFAVVLLWVGGG